MRLKSLSLLFTATLVFAISIVKGQAPTITSFSPSSGPVGTLVTITGTNLSNPTSVSIGGVGAIVVSSSTTELKAMVMPGAVNGVVEFFSNSGNVQSVNSFTKSPPKILTDKNSIKVFAPNDASVGPLISPVSISADGQTAVVGDPGDNSNTGAIRVYVKNNGSWVSQGSKIVANDAVGNAFQGLSVSINADGNTIVVGGNYDNYGVGAVWVFTQNGGVWSQQGNKLVGSGAIGNASQGASVSISADGNTLISGGYSDNSEIGAAWIFVRSNGVWTQFGNKLVGTGYSGISGQGHSVAISADGKTAIVGGLNDDNSKGAAWVFSKVGNNWVQQGNKLVGSDAVGNGWQGRSVALNADGNYAIVGSPTDNLAKGAAWVYKRENGVWVQDGNKLIGSDLVGNSAQGHSVAISYDGKTCILGGISDNSLVGAAWVFRRNQSSWYQFGNKLVESNDNDLMRQGVSVSISGDANTMIVGGNNYSSIDGFLIYNSIPDPEILTYSSLKGAIGSLIKFSGVSLSLLNSVTVGGTEALIVSKNDSTMTVMIMPGTSNGPVVATSNYGHLLSIGTFIVTPTKVPINHQNTIFHVIPGKIYNMSSVTISADGNSIMAGFEGPTNINEAALFRRDNDGRWMYQFKTIDSSLMSFGNSKTNVSGKADLSEIVASGGQTQGFYDQGVNKFIRKRRSFTNPMTFAWPDGPVSMSADGKTTITGTYFSGLSLVRAIITNRVSSDSFNTMSLYETQLFTTPPQGAPIVYISSDGKTAVVGTPKENSGNGVVRIFIKQNNLWILQNTLNQPQDAVGNSNFGIALALSADGNVLVVGANEDNLGKGAAWIFNRVGSSWSQVGNKIVPNDMLTNAAFGTSVATSADGKVVIVGGPNEENNSGAIWAFNEINGVWQQFGSKRRSNYLNTSTAFFGRSIAISSDGNTAVITALINNTVVGAFIYTAIGAPTFSSITPNTGTIGTVVTIKGSGFLGSIWQENGDRLKFGGTYPSSWGVLNDSTITATIWNGSTGPITLYNNSQIGTSNFNFTYIGTGVPGGGTGGLESKSLGDAVGKRIINNAFSNKSTLVDYSKLTVIDENGQTHRAASTGTALTLAQILPKKISNGEYKAYTSTPTDIPSFTNAIEALSIDFTLQNKARAVAFGTKTLGGVYDHTKAVCDRLKGAELLKIENVQVQGINLVKFELINARGQKEYAYSFVIGAKNGRNDYTIQSTWLNKNYTPDEVMFNIQLWAETPGLINDMANDIIYRLGQNMPVREIAKNEALPVTYITKGKRESEHIVLEITNATANSNGYFEVQERANEQSNNLVKKQIPVTIAHNGNTTIKLPVGDIYESTISLFVNGKMEDQVFMADGNWGTELTTNNTSIKSFKINNNTKPYVDSMGEFKLFRNIQLEANSQDNITVYKLLRGGGAPQDLSDYKTFKFTAAGSGANLKIILLRDSISNWADQYSVSIPLSANATEYKIGLTDFKSKTVKSNLTPNDITTVVFVYEVTNKGSNTLVNAALSDLSFSKIDYAYLNSLNSREINIYPNPASNKFFATFKSHKEVKLNLVVRDAASGRVVFSKWVNAIKGENTVSVDINKSIGMSNYILNLEGSDIKYQSKKVIVTQ